MSDTQYTADELRKEANSTVLEVFDDDGNANIEYNVEVSKHDERTKAMLSAGADAMDALAKAKERVNELEEALRWYGSRGYNCNNYTTIGDVGRDALAKDGGAKARAALQVKP